ncbi:hypothetical protein QNH14_14145 [Apirhabdus apintestini]|nr:hypothetical protein QNH14_14145 [Enterobacteriaceae bacterium CA-0114]
MSKHFYPEKFTNAVQRVTVVRRINQRLRALHQRCAGISRFDAAALPVKNIQRYILKLRAIREFVYSISQRDIAKKRSGVSSF